MTDRELLERASKAAGIKLMKQFVIADKVAKTEDGNLWAPLIDDGDALRLAVKLHFEISVDCISTSISGICDSDKDFVLERHGDDPYAATRRAIVRAAAEIGKSK